MERDFTVKGQMYTIKTVEGNRVGYIFFDIFDSNEKRLTGPLAFQCPEDFMLSEFLDLIESHAKKMAGG